MGQEEPEPIRPEGDDPGTEVAEGDHMEATAPEGGPAPEGADPGRIEIFDLGPERLDRLDLSGKGRSSSFSAGKRDGEGG